MRFIRAGTLDRPEKAPPDVHIFTSYKLPYFALHDGKPQFSEFYDLQEVWSERSLERLVSRSNPSYGAANSNFA